MKLTIMQQFNFNYQRSLNLFAITLLLIFSCCIFSQSITVNNAGELISAVKKMNGGEANEIVLKPGDYNIALPLLLSSTTETSKVIKSVNAGSVNITGNIFFRFSGNNYKLQGLHFHKTMFLGNTKEIVQMNNSKDCVVDNCTFAEDAYGSDYKQANTYFISVVGAQRSIISNNKFNNKTNNGGLIIFNQLYPDSAKNSHKIFGNYFGKKAFGSAATNIIMRLGLSGDKTTESANFNSNIKIYNNTFEDYNAYSELISIKCSNVEIHDNTFKRCAGYISIRNGNDCNIYNNRFYGEGQKRTCGVRIQGGNHRVVHNYFENLDQALLIFGGNGNIINGEVPGYINTKNITITDNSIINCKNAFSFIFSADRKNYALPENCVIKNNLFVVPKGGNLVYNNANPDIENLGNLVSFSDNVVVQKERGKQLSGIKSLNNKITTANTIDVNDSNVILDKQTGRYKYKMPVNKKSLKASIGFQ